MRGLLALLFASAFAGCASVPADVVPEERRGVGPSPLPDKAAPVDACPPEVDARAAFDAARAWFEDLEGETFSFRLEGKMDGVRRTTMLAVSPDDLMVRMSDTAEEFDVRIDPYEYSIRVGDQVGFGRNAERGAMFRDFYASFLDGLEEDAAFRFRDDRRFEDFTVTCPLLGVTPVIRYASAQDGVEAIISIERDAPHRPLSATNVDPIRGDSYRMSISPEVPDLDLQRRLPRLPATLAQDVIRFTSDEGGTRLHARFDERSHWVALAQLEFHFVQLDTGDVLMTAPLRPGTHDLPDGGTFTFNDVDRDGLLSSGDTFIMDVGPGVDVSFYDTWAGGYITWADAPGPDAEAPGLPSSMALDRVGPA